VHQRIQSGRLEGTITQINDKGTPTVCLDIGTRVAKPGNVIWGICHGVDERSLGRAAQATFQGGASYRVLMARKRVKIAMLLRALL